MAARQRGLITLEQLVMLGLSETGVRSRVGSGRLHRVRRGVFSLSPSLMPFARELAAVLACGEGAMVSHRTAAALYGLLPARGEIHITVPTRNGRGGEGLKVHRPKTPPRRIVRDGIPTTTIEQTLLDLAATETADQLERAINEARVRGLARDRTLHALAEQSANRRGANMMRAALHVQSHGFTRSRAERKLRQLVEQAGLPQPSFNHRVQDRERDAVWNDQRLVVEIDGYATHGTRRAFEEDRNRDQELTADGWRVMRITWRQLTDEPTRTAARLARAVYSP